jgi:hypothetical protein
MTATDWRTYATEANQQRFADAHARLDDLEVHPDGTITTYGVEGEYAQPQRREDERFTDWYDQAVLAAAQDEFERHCEQADFDRAYPEPADGARIEWEGDGGTLYAAYRQDLPEFSGGSWWLYGTDLRMTWRQLVTEYQLPTGLADVAMLVEEQR